VEASEAVGIGKIMFERRKNKIVTNITEYIDFTLCTFDTWRILHLKDAVVNSDKEDILFE